MPLAAVAEVCHQELCASAASTIDNVAVTHLLPASLSNSRQNTLKPHAELVVLAPQRLVFLPVPPKPPDKKFGDDGKTEFMVFGRVPQTLPLILPNPVNLVFPFAFETKSGTSLRSLVFVTRPLLHHSIILQIDGLLYACFRLRLERDVCVLHCDTAFCDAVGPGVSPASTFCGLFWPAPSLLSAVILAVKYERGYGVFVGPTDCDAWKLLMLPLNQRTTTYLTFTFTGLDNLQWCARFCSFVYQGKIKRKKPDLLFAIVPIYAAQVPLRVSILPFCPARISSMQHIPVASDDTAKQCSPLPLAMGIPRPTQLSVWNVHVMKLLAPMFPHADVRALFLQAVLPSGARLMFAGDNNKRVLVANAPMKPEILAQIRERFVSEVAKGRMMGPFDRCPFPNEWNSCQARSTPLDTRKKDKYDILSERFRVVSNFSAGRARSINNLIYSPKLLSSHLQSSQLRDLLFSLGPGARFNAIDQQDAFRADHINLADAHLYCYQLVKEWFIDLRDPFGNVKSEYTYAIIVAVLKWAFGNDEKIIAGDSKIIGYVDNWFLLSRANCPSHDARWSHLKSVFELIGAPMHEEQSSLLSVVNALGWDWDTLTNSFSCPTDKYNNCLRLSIEWARRAAADDVFLFTEIDSIAGLFQWISTACPAIIPAVASLQALKHAIKLSGQHERRLDGRSATAVVALATFFKSWNRSCPIFAGFSPVAQWEFLLRVDASTDFGAGGFCLPSATCFIHAWSADERARALAHSSTPIRESTTFFELQGILLALTHFAPQLRGKRVQIECDNEGAIRDLVTCFSGKTLCMEVIAQIRDLCAAFFITTRFEHILASFNCIADSLSHDLFPQAYALCQQELQVNLLEPHRF